MTPIEAEAKHIQLTYARKPILIARGRGARVWDAEARIGGGCEPGGIDTS